MMLRSLSRSGNSIISRSSGSSNLINNVNLNRFFSSSSTATISSSHNNNHANDDESSGFHYNSEAERNQAQWAEWESAKLNLYIFGSTLACFGIASYWYNKEVDHFSHHRWEQEPYPYFINRDSANASGWWPGRHCQFFEFNCFAAAYDEADKLLAEKEGHGAKHSNKGNKHH